MTKMYSTFVAACFFGLVAHQQSGAAEPHNPRPQEPCLDQPTPTLHQRVEDATAQQAPDSLRILETTPSLFTQVVEMWVPRSTVFNRNASRYETLLERFFGEGRERSKRRTSLDERLFQTKKPFFREWSFSSSDALPLTEFPCSWSDTFFAIDDDDSTLAQDTERRLYSGRPPHAREQTLPRSQGLDNLAAIVTGSEEEEDPSLF